MCTLLLTNNALYDIFMFMKHYYTGIGSRKAPRAILDDMTATGRHLAAIDYVLRSGGAPGSDTAFQIGCPPHMGHQEIYLPGDTFSGNSVNEDAGIYNVKKFDNYENARTIAAEFHPTWGGLSPYVKVLMTRNVYQVLGLDLETYSDFVACWTPDGSTGTTTKDTGGTGQAIRIADHYDIPIYNMLNEDDRKIVVEWGDWE